MSVVPPRTRRLSRSRQRRTRAAADLSRAPLRCVRLRPRRQQHRGRLPPTSQRDLTPTVEGHPTRQNETRPWRPHLTRLPRFRRRQTVHGDRQHRQRLPSGRGAGRASIGSTLLLGCHLSVRAVSREGGVWRAVGHRRCGRHLLNPAVTLDPRLEIVDLAPEHLGETPRQRLLIQPLRILVLLPGVSGRRAAAAADWRRLGEPARRASARGRTDVDRVQCRSGLRRGRGGQRARADAAGRDSHGARVLAGWPRAVGLPASLR